MQLCAKFLFCTYDMMGRKRESITTYVYLVSFIILIHSIHIPIVHTHSTYPHTHSLYSLFIRFFSLRVRIHSQFTTHRDIDRYRQMSSLFLKINIPAKDTSRTVKVQGEETVGDIIKQILKRFPGEEHVNYGLFLPKRQTAEGKMEPALQLDDAKPLSFYNLNFEKDQLEFQLIFFKV